MEKAEKVGRAKKGNDPISLNHPLTQIAARLQTGQQMQTALSGRAETTNGDTHAHSRHARLNTQTQPKSRRLLRLQLSASQKNDCQRQSRTTPGKRAYASNGSKQKTVHTGTPAGINTRVT